jgi:hypothetical protein
MKNIILAVSLVGLASIAHFGCAKDSGSKGTNPSAETGDALRAFGAMVADLEHVTATVEKVDAKTREITLRGPEGKSVTFVASKEVRNFAQIEEGDKVELDYTESVTIIAGGAPGAPAREGSVEIQRAAQGEKPAGAALAATRVLATVEAIDYEARTATLKGPLRTVKIKADQRVRNFNQVKVGDRVYLEVTQALAVAVTK